MRKRILENGGGRETIAHETGWLDLGDIATVEVTSEQEGFPVEAVFNLSGGRCWRAGRPGEQLLRLIFDAPITLERIRLRFEETERQRTQEFTISWCSASGRSAEIVRQQWNFSPVGSTSEIEDYAVNLEAVSALELRIRPDTAGSDAVASLAEWRVAGSRNPRA